MKTKFIQRRDGEGFNVPNGEPFRLACCDCGLVHDVVVVSAGDQQQELGMAARRNIRETLKRRRLRKIVAKVLRK